MSYPELLLSNQLCFLIYRLDLAIGAKYRPVLNELGLTYGQYLAMLVLWEHRSLGVGELCSYLGLDTGTISPLIKRLEAAGFVERKRRKDDERAVTVTLTKAGAALEHQARKVPETLARCLATDESEYRKTRAILEEMIHRIEATPKEVMKGALET